MTFDELEKLTTKWAMDRRILTNGKVITQVMKLGEEFGELCSHIAKGQDIKDDIGDMIVVLNNIAKMSNTNLKECWATAYEDIKDRKGFLTKDGVFIKETDPNYKEATKRKKEPVVTSVSFNLEPALFHTYKIYITLEDGAQSDYTLTSTSLISIPANLDSLFKGKTVEQLLIYLKTLGEINGN